MRRSQFILGCMLFALVGCKDAIAPSQGNGSGGLATPTVELYGLVAVTGEDRLALQTDQSLVLLVGAVDGLVDAIGRPMYVAGYWAAGNEFAVMSYRMPDDSDDATLRVKRGG